MNFIRKNTIILYLLVITVVCFFLYFINISSYPFMDEAETRFVTIAKDMLINKDWLNIKLNGQNIFSIKPLYFWITNISCIIFGKISPDAVRLPISITALLIISGLFFTIQKILTKVYALIISSIMATSFGILVFSRLSTADIYYLFFTMCAILCSYLAIFSRKGNKAYKYWLGIYIFSALSVMTSGLYGLITCLFAIIAMHIFSGDLKEIFKPKNLLPGLIIFFIITMPWTSFMVHEYGITFIKESLQQYNFIHYISLKNISIVIGLFLLGFSPWIFSFLWILGTRFKNIIISVITYFKENSQDKLKEKWKKLSLSDKFISLNTIVFFVSFVVALLYGINNTGLILFMIFPASCNAGYFWWEYLVKKKHDKSIFFATMIPNIIMIICSIIGLFGHNILNKWLFQGLNHVLIPLVIIFFIIPVIGIFAVILKGRTLAYCTNLILMASLSFILVPSIFNFVCINTGENDLITFARRAQENNVKIQAFLSIPKYSLVYYYDKPVIFQNNKDLTGLKTYLKNNKKDYAIVEIKDMWNIDDNKIKYMLLDAGVKYSLIQYMDEIQEQEEDAKEPEVIVY